MILEKIIFNLLAFALFTIIFMKMIRKNDTSYVYILGLQFLGLVINFIELFFDLKLNMFWRIIIYILSIILPAVILIIERTKPIDFPQMYRLILAKICIHSGKTEEAKEYLFSLINKYPKSYLGHKMLAELYEMEGKNEIAIDEYIRVTEINNKDIQMNYKIASLLNKEGKNEEAVNVLQDILKQKPELYEGAALLGEILFSQERYKEAILVYMGALKYHPGNYDLYYNLGMSCTMINDFQRAKEFYDKAAQINSLLYHAKLSLGQIAMIYGELEEAEKYFNESSKGEEVESGSYYYLALVALLKGDKEKAVNYMNVAISLEPRIYEKIQKETVFMPIMKNINAPTKEVLENSKENKLTGKERKITKHLSKTCSLVSSLNNDDIKTMVTMKKKEKQIEDRQRENE